MSCAICNKTIDPIRLEVLPETTICKDCAKSREPVKPTVIREPALDPTPYITATIPPLRQFEKSFVVKKKKAKVKKKEIKKYRQIGGLKKKDTHNTVVPKGAKIPVVFHSNGNTHQYQYKVSTFERTFKVNRNEIHAAINAGYTFYVDEGILYLNRNGKDVNVRIGNFHKRKPK